jgi:hypothetical protein
LQLVNNGKVVFEQPAEKTGDHFAARFGRELRVESPGWLAIRIAATAKNELGGTLYAHTSPVYVDLAGRRVFDLDAAQALLRQIEEGRAAIQARGRFSSPAAAARMVALYDEAARDLTQRMSRRGR